MPWLMIGCNAWNERLISVDGTANLHSKCNPELLTNHNWLKSWKYKLHTLKYENFLFLSSELWCNGCQVCLAISLMIE